MDIGNGWVLEVMPSGNVSQAAGPTSWVFALMAIGWCEVTGVGKRNHLPDRDWPRLGDDNLSRPQPCVRADLSVQKYFRSLPRSIARDPFRFCGPAFSAIDPLCDSNLSACARCADGRISSTFRRICRGWPRYRAGQHCGGGVVGADNLVLASGTVATPGCSNLEALLPAS